MQTNEKEKQLAHLTSERAKLLVTETIGPDRPPRRWVLVFALPKRWGTWCHNFPDGPWVPLEAMRFHLRGGLGTDFERALKGQAQQGEQWAQKKADPKAVRAMEACGLALETHYPGIEWMLIGEDGAGALPLLTNMDAREVPGVLAVLVSELEAKLVRPRPH